jgi:hypothetical protein
MSRQKRQDIIDSLNSTKEELLGLLTRVYNEIEPFTDGGPDGAHDPYSPGRVAAARHHLLTAAMHVGYLFDEIPHVPKSSRAPEVPKPDDNEE